MTWNVFQDSPLTIVSLNSSWHCKKLNMSAMGSMRLDSLYLNENVTNRNAKYLYLIGTPKLAFVYVNISMWFKTPHVTENLKLPGISVLWSVFQNREIFLRSDYHMYFQIKNAAEHHIVHQQFVLWCRLYFQHDGVPPGNHTRVTYFTHSGFRRRRIERIDYPPRSPDLTPLGFCLWSDLKNTVYIRESKICRIWSRKLKLLVLLSHQQQWEKYATLLHVVFNNALRAGGEHC
jgi:hypothetical protein